MENIINNNIISIGSLPKSVSYVIQHNADILCTWLWVDIITDKYEYTITTKAFTTTIKTRQWIDLVIMQTHCNTEKNILVSPYSSPGYDVYLSLLLWYYQIYKKLPIVYFSDTGIEQKKWNNIWLENDMHNAFTFFHIYQYLFDNTIIPLQEWSPWFIVNTKLLTLRCIGMHDISDKPKDLFFETDILPLYIQSYIDTQLAVSWKDNVFYLKKIYNSLDQILKSPLDQREEKFASLFFL